MALPSLVIFGPQTSLPSADQLLHLRSTLLQDHRLVTFLAAIRDLPKLWPILVETNPSLGQVPGLQLLEGIKKWIDDGEFAYQTSEEIPNIILTSLTVILHIVEYFNFLGNLEHGMSHSEVLENARIGGIQGFCTGFLAAIAVASSVSEQDINDHGAVALRLAVCIGACVDLDGRFAEPVNETSCLSVRWMSEMGKCPVLDTLRDYPDAYISVLTDATSATITVPTSCTSPIVRHLLEKGFSVKSIRLRGRFHSSIHEGALQNILSLCKSNASLRFPSDNYQLLGLRDNSNAQVITRGSLHEIALRSLLIKQSDWYLTIMNSISRLPSRETQHVLVVGLVDCIPRSVLKGSNLQVANVRNNKITISVSAKPDRLRHSHPDHAIAIIGMGCRFPGADSVEEFWDVIQSGSSMLGELPKQRFPTNGLRRSPDSDLQFLGNFIQDADAFDHRFFKCSSREAASMDPQHRLALQVAYEALESSGYFSRKPVPRDIGCYLGVAASDYEDNIASHLPTAFSVTGMLRSFTSGKISHFFGLSGPSIVYDTACSSSAVAIHSACKAVSTGECSMALAGGVNIITSPTLYQNLTAAKFLSPTGASKAFDAKADGYCRGEGAGIILLKRLSAAIADNDNILGVIAGSAINQNDNYMPITVPSSNSQSNLYRRVMSLGGIEPKDVSYVEGHGTGTVKGDPIECESIRQVFGGQSRKLYFGSVKGSIGHTEAASGIAGVIKVLLMIQHKFIPKQASFTILNPNIAPLEPSNMAIATTGRGWNTTFKAACINNYGAAGSNAAILVCQPPIRPSLKEISLSKYPIFISADSPASLQAYCLKLKNFLARERPEAQEKLLANAAFNLAYKQNHSQSHRFTTTASSLAELETQLDVGSSGSHESLTNITTLAKPVILVFPGQTGLKLNFGEEAYQDSILLQYHLNECNRILQSIGLKGLFPGIFSSEPVEDVIDLHCMLFSIQYACAKSWIDCGLDVKTVIGHSFGQLTALCVAGSLSLEHALTLISGRASLIKDKWGAERGSMISLDTDLATTMKIMFMSEQAGEGNKVEIACYNGPTSHVLVGTKAAIDAVELVISHGSPTLGPIKKKRLDLSYGFHSQFVDDIMPDYLRLVETLAFNKPTVPIETCSKGESWTEITPALVAKQSRESVYFADAIGRIEQRLGSCAWVEAGSGSPAMSMVRRAIGSSTSSAHLFYPVNLHCPDPMSSLAELTLNLWRAGTHVQFWPFHDKQSEFYLPMNLPPYQFEKSRHWLEYIDICKVPESTNPAAVDSKPSLMSFIKHADSDQRIAEFSVHQTSEQYQSYVSGHAVLGHNLCPAALYIETAARAATTLKPDFASQSFTPNIENLEMYVPLGINASQDIHVTLKAIEGSKPAWDFTITSYTRDQPSRTTKHATAQVSLLSSGHLRMANCFARFERLVNYDRCEFLLDDPNAEAIQGSYIYKMFAKVVSYSDIYRGVTKISTNDHEVAGHVTMHLTDSSGTHGTVTNPLAVDNFTQVAGLHVNSLPECGENEIFVCTKIDQLQYDQRFTNVEPNKLGSWLVYSISERKSNHEFANDIFVFDRTTKSLVITILGVRFTKAMINSLRKTLSRANTTQALTSTEQDNTPPIDYRVKSYESLEDATKAISPAFIARKQIGSHLPVPSKDNEEAKLQRAVQKLLFEVADVPINDISESSPLRELGIDSLMATELLSEISERFGIKIPALEFDNILDFKSLYQYILSRQSHKPDVFSRDTDSSIGLSKTDTQEAHPTPTSCLESDSYGELFVRLSKLVTEHLETMTEIPLEMDIREAGLDSLVGIELGNDIEKTFGTRIDMTQLNEGATFGDLYDMVIPPQSAPKSTSMSKMGDSPSMSKMGGSPSSTGLLTLSSANSTISTTDNGSNRDQGRSLTTNYLAHAPKDFASIRHDYGRFATETGWADFRTRVYPQQAQLVLAYVLEAFTALGCPLESFNAGEPLPAVQHIPKHSKVVSQFHKVLEDGSLIFREGASFLRSAMPICKVRSKQLYEQIISAVPQHAYEHKLLNSTGSKLADCLSGKVNPLDIIFGTKADRELLTEVYTHSPMFATGTRLLGEFYVKTFSNYHGPEKLRILELGAGTGGTTEYIVDLLLSHKIEFTYTFTDISASMVAAAKRKFGHYSCMDFMTLDVERAPPKELLHSYHTILSSNCVHATKSLLESSKNIHAMLRNDGFLCLLELTRNLYWFDCVFGLLEGWWLFEDGRKHVLADEFLWQKTLLEAGFKHIDWSDDDTEESDLFRVIAAFVSELRSSIATNERKNKTTPSVETVQFHQVNDTSLYADIYFPVEAEEIQVKRPIALMIHGGGHVMLSRKDIRPKQTQLLLENGLLPVSVDYRLCPEVTLLEGPIPDVCTALQWARHVLPTLVLQRPDVHPDGDNVVVVGWSTGGTLSMTLAWSALQRGIKPPEAILAFYCPSNYEAEFWKKPNYPEGTSSKADEDYDLLDGIQDKPITSYNVPAGKWAVGGWMSLSDHRSRIALHMNWKGQVLPVLLKGLPSKNRLSDSERTSKKWLSLPIPDTETIIAASPRSQIVLGNYSVPTYFIQGTEDDLVPWQQTKETYDALVQKGVPTGVALVNGAVHLFDLYRDTNGKYWQAVQKGYNFLFEQLRASKCSRGSLPRAH